MYKLLHRSVAFFSDKTQKMLKNFGITNPNIARNLRYSLLLT